MTASISQEKLTELLATVNRYRAALTEVVRVGTWTGTDENTYRSHEGQIAAAALKE